MLTPDQEKALRDIKWKPTHFSSRKWRPSRDDIERAIKAVNTYRPENLSVHNMRTLAVCAQQWRFDCKALNCADQDCNWPLCGCDPYADKVIATFAESYAPFDTEEPLDYETLKQFYISIVGMK